MTMRDAICFACFALLLALLFGLLCALRSKDPAKHAKQKAELPPQAFGAAEPAHGRMAKSTKEKHMTNWSQPPVITVTTPGVLESVNDRPAISHPMVRRRVVHPDGLDWLGTIYPQGSVVILASDRAYPLELSGHLAKLDGEL